MEAIQVTNFDQNFGYNIENYPWEVKNSTDFPDYDSYDPSKHNYSDFSAIWYRKPGWEVAVKSIAVLPVMAIGILGNLSVICLILSLKSLRKSHINLFIMNMAFADLLTTLFCPWLSLVNNIYQNYELGPIFCKFEAFFKMMCILAGVLSLITISFDRFIAFVFPFKKHLNRKVSYVIIASIWALAIILSTPLAVWRTYHERKWLDFDEKWCGEENVATAKYYWMFLMIPVFYFPLLVMVVIYSYIIKNMGRFEKTISINETPVRIKHTRTIIKMLFFYIITAIICWLPLQITVYYRKLKPLTATNGTWYFEVCFISQLFASANAAINPIITFRKTFAHLLPKLFKSKKGQNRVMPLDVLVLQQHLDMARPSMASDSTQKKMRLANISDGLHSHTTSFTKHIMMKRAPELFLRDET